MRLRYEKLAGELLILTPDVRNSLSGAEISLSPTLLDASDADVALRFCPARGRRWADRRNRRADRIRRAGKIRAVRHALRPTLLRIWGPACYTLRPRFAQKKIWQRDSLFPQPWRMGSGRRTPHPLMRKEAQAFTGNYFMRNCQLDGARYAAQRHAGAGRPAWQGAQRGYYAGLYGAGRAAIMVMHGGENAPAGADAAGLDTGPGIHALPVRPGRPADP